MRFRHGGFESGGLATEGSNVALVPAFNVLRQYDEHEVAGAWGTMQRSLAPGGAIVEGTCDEAG